MARVKLNEAHIAAMPNAPAGSSRVDYDTETRGLAVRVTGTGYKGFLFCYVFDGLERRMPIGVWTKGAGTLTWARARAAELRLRVAAGADPAQDKANARDAREREKIQAAKEITFASLAARYIAEHAAKKRSGHEDERRIGSYVLPAWGKRKVKDITRADVDAFVSPVATGDMAKGLPPRPAEANQRLALVRKMFSFAVDKGIIDVHPCIRMKAPGGAIAPRKRALRTAEEFKLFEEITGGGEWSEFIGPDEADALRLVMYTGCRASEATDMPTAELDLDQAVWKLPAARSKNKRENYVPLIKPAIEMLKRRVEKVGEYVFPAKRAKHLDDGHLSRALRAACAEWQRRGIEVAPFTTHDLRRTVETGMAAAKVPKEYRDRVLNHADASVGGQHYDQHDYLDEKREALEKWARRLETMLRGTSDNVVPIGRAGR